MPNPYFTEKVFHPTGQNTSNKQNQGNRGKQGNEGRIGFAAYADTLNAKLLNCQPKYAELKLEHSDVFNTRSPEITTTDMQSEQHELKPNTQMAEVQARFSDLIF